jgi:mannose-6-phosphate isomerase-like protein (cupin superfamily)
VPAKTERICLRFLGSGYRVRGRFRLRKQPTQDLARSTELSVGRTVKGRVKAVPERKTRITTAAEQLVQPFTHTILGQVDDYCAYLSRFLGPYKFHDHTKDEMYIVLEGEIYIDYYDGPSILLRQGEVLVVKAGERHRSRSQDESLVLMFKAAHLFAE